MIALAQDCLVFKAANGQCIPFSVDMICVELAGDSASLFEPEAIRQACHAVFHYFKKELGKDTLTMAEFTQALERALRGLLDARNSASAEPAGNTSATSSLSCASSAPRFAEADLGVIASESGKGCELFFFPSLRAELHRQIQERSPVIIFRGLRRCVKQLLGARRWSRRCGEMSDQIVEYMRQCLSECTGQTPQALVVE